MEMEVDEGHFSRTAASLAVNDRFVIVKSSFERQYAQMYFLRLTKMRQALQARAQAVWPASEGLVHVNSIRDIPTDRECAVVGTVFKEMKNRPCILDEYDKVKSNAAKARALHTSPDDSLILEDDTGRIRLANQPDSTVLDIKGIVSGPVIALRGTVNAAGVFVVRECCFANVPPQSPLAAPSPASAPRYLCLVSGLHIGDGTVDPLPRQLFADFVCGFLGTSSDQRCSASIQQVIIAGNLLSTFDTEAEAGQSKQAAITKAARPLVECDAVLSQLCSAAPVLLMPGDSDPANYTMPQQPLHACMFKRAATFSTFRSTTNPCDVRVDDTHVIGTSGQNITDMSKFCDVPDPLDLLESTLRWGHMAPTAPDSLPCYPMNEDEPFVLSAAPHIYFAANQTEFRTRLVQGEQGQRVRLVLVPKFATSSTIVLVNLDTLECEPVHFAVPTM